MRSSHKVLGVTLAAIVASSIGIGANAQTAGASAAPAAGHALTYGVIDRDKVVASYPKAQQAAEDLKKLEDQLQRTIEDANKKYEEAKKSNKPEAELTNLQKSLQRQIDSEGERFKSRVTAMEGDLEGAVDGAIKAEAASRHVDVVLLKQAVVFGGVDLTDGVVKRLTGTTTTATAPKSTAK